MKSVSLKSTIISFVTLMIFWYIMSGYFDVIHSIMGVISVSLVLVLNRQYKRQRLFEDEHDIANEIRFIYVPYYMIWLGFKIITSAFQVVRILLAPTINIKPQMVRFKVNLPNVQAKVILGNSISLTPGTLTVDIDGDEFLIHSLVPRSYENIINDVMPHQVLKLFSKELYPVVSDVKIIEAEEQV